MIYKIFRNCHFSWPLFRPAIFNTPLLKTCGVDVIFNRSCTYDFGDNPKQGDTNKLFGYSQGYHHRNSVRVGWRWNVAEQKMHICYYAYENGKNIHDGLFADICGINLGQRVFISLKSEFISKQLLQDTVEIFDYESKALLGKYTKVRQVKYRMWQLSYYLTPYFGGTMRAPQTMTINLNWYKN